VGDHFREKAHLRDPLLVDFHSYRATEMLVEAEWKYAYPSLLYQYLCPSVLIIYLLLLKNKVNSNLHIGFSYHDHIKYQNKSKFLGSFYKGDKASY
jgi:hypothetical protein